MKTKTRSVRISESAWEILNSYKKKYGIPITKIIDVATRDYKDKVERKGIL